MTQTTTSYDALPQIEKDVIEFSEWHKEARGFRPRGTSMEAFRALSESERAERISHLAAKAGEAYDAEKESLQAAVHGEWNEEAVFEATASWGDYFARMIGI